MRNKLNLAARIVAISALVGIASKNGWAQIPIPASIQSASSSLGSPFDRLAEYAVNGAGLDGQTHTIVPDAFMWLNNGVFAAPNDLEPEITFDLGFVQALGSVKVWNYNETLPGRPELIGRGVGSADILVAGEDLVFTPLISGQAFDIGPGLDNVDFGQVIGLAGASARYVKIDILGNHGGDNNFVGLSEVQFFAALDLLGDFNADLVIDLIDFDILAGNFRNQGTVYEDGDMNFDGTIDLRDFAEWRIAFDGFNGAGAAVPETATGLAFALGLMIIGLLRRSTPKIC